MTEATALRLLVFQVGDLAYAAGMDAVREIVPTTPAARLPGAPPAVRGLINVRGTLVPVIDGSIALTGRPAPSDGATTVLLEAHGSTVGLTVGEVLDLVSVDAEALTEREALSGVDPRIVRAIGRHAGLVFVVLDLDAVLGPLLPS